MTCHTLTQTHVTAHTVTAPVIGTEIKRVLLASMQGHQIGILGGTFNPPHLGHLLVAEGVYNALHLNKILFIPDATPPHIQGKHALPAKERVAMVKEAIADNPHFCLDQIEVKRGGKSYTVDTMKELKRRDPLAQYYFIIGADMVNDLPNWHQIDELVKLVTFVAVRRPGVTPQSQYPVIWVDVPQVAISSSDIRRRVEKGESIRYLVPDGVAAYIKEHHLYEKQHA